MEKTNLFNSNRTQAVRLPKSVAFPKSVKKVCIVKVGRSRLITPEQNSWDAFFAAPPASDDFMADREQPPAQNREAW